MIIKFFIYVLDYGKYLCYYKIKVKEGQSEFLKFESYNRSRDE